MGYNNLVLLAGGRIVTIFTDCNDLNYAIHDSKKNKRQIIFVTKNAT